MHRVLVPVFMLIGMGHKRIRQMPQDYACVCCDQRFSDHETWVESRADRIARGGSVDVAYLPSTMQAAVRAITEACDSVGIASATGAAAGKASGIDYGEWT